MIKEKIKLMRKILALALAFCLCLPMGSLTILAEDQFTSEGEDLQAAADETISSDNSSITSEYIQPSQQNTQSNSTSSATASDTNSANTASNTQGTLKNIEYLDQSGTLCKAANCVLLTSPAASTTAISDGSSELTIADNWYYVNGNTVFPEKLIISGEVNLILLDNSILDLQKGLTVDEGSTLNIYAQSTGEKKGQIKASGTEHSAGIGGNQNNSGTIIINGGYIIAAGGAYAAGIGSDYNYEASSFDEGTQSKDDLSDLFGSGGESEIVINGGTVLATGGSDAPAIGNITDEEDSPGFTAGEKMICRIGDSKEAGGSFYISDAHTPDESGQCIYGDYSPTTETEEIPEEATIEAETETSTEAAEETSTEADGKEAAETTTEADSRKAEEEAEEAEETEEAEQQTSDMEEIFDSEPAGDDFTDGEAAADFDDSEDALFTSGEKEAVKLDGYSLTLDGQIGINFGMALSGEALPDDLSDMSDYYMEFELNGSSTVVELAEAVILEDEIYTFTCPVTAIELADTITAVYHYGGKESLPIEYSVDQYLNDIIEHSEDADMVDLAKKMINYGYYSSIYLASLRGWTYGSDHAALQKIYGVPDTGADLSSYVYQLSDDSDTIDFDSMQLNLESQIDLHLNFTAEDDIENHTFKVNGRTMVPETITDEDGTFYRIAIEQIPVAELGDSYQISVDGKVTVQVSALSAVSLALGTDGISAKCKNAMAALYEYYQAAKSYAESIG